MSNESDIYGTIDGESAGLLFKLKDGEEARVRIVSTADEAVRFESYYAPKKSTSLRFGWVIYNMKAKRAQIFMASGTVYGLIKNYIMNPEYGDITKYDISIKREGEDTDTKYFITAGRNNYELPDDKLAECHEIDLKGEIAKKDYNSQIMTLREFHDLATADTDRPASSEGSGYANAKATAKATKNKDTAPEHPDKVIEDIGDEPINLDDIPF